MTRPDRVRPDHVRPELVRDFSFEFVGPVDELFGRLDRARTWGPVFWSDTAWSFAGEARGGWVLTTAADIRAVLQDPATFSSRSGVSGDGPALIPIFLDPPEHNDYRRLLAPLFAPAVAQAMEAGIRSTAVELIEAVRLQGNCDFVADIALQFPTRIFTTWLGLPVDDTPKLVAMVSAMLHGEAGDMAMAVGAAAGVLLQLIAERRSAPAGDLMSELLALELDGRPLSDDEVFRTAFLLFLAGLDTVVAALSLSFAHLAVHPADRRALASGVVPSARAAEEMLREFSFVATPRRCTRPTEVSGVAMAAGDLVVVPLAFAGRDPAEHDRATEVDLDRSDLRHYAFGAGPHRCAGSHLARLEMQVFFDEWHARIPDYQLAGEPIAYGGTVMGMQHLPLRWD